MTPQERMEVWDALAQALASPNRCWASEHYCLHCVRCMELSQPEEDEFIGQVVSDAHEANAILDLVERLAANGRRCGTCRDFDVALGGAQ